MQWLGDWRPFEDRYPDRRGVYVTAIIVLSYLVSHVGFAGIAGRLDGSGLIALEPTASLPVAFGMVMGPTTVVGVILGVVAVETVSKALAIETVFVVLAHLYMARCGYHLRSFALPPAADEFAIYRLEYLASYLRIALIASGGGALIFAWGYEITNTAPFYVTVTAAFVRFIGSVVVLGVIVLFVVSIARNRLEAGESADESNRVSAGSLRRVATLTAAWGILGYVGSVGYRLFERIPRFAFVNRDVEFLLVFDQSALLGVGASKLQILFGAVMFGLLFSSVSHRTPRGVGGE